MNKKYKNLRDHLAEAVAMMPPEEQQAEREALKAGKLTPTLAAALSLLGNEMMEVAKPHEAPASSAAELTALLTEIRAVKAAVEKKPAPAISTGMSEEEKHEVRKRLGGIEDKVSAIRPSTFKALLVCLALGGIIGGILGWYGCVEYHTRGARQHRHIVEAE